jgi:anaerobic magnesium-protoporphyrin IX monomethyl ester cyclase
VNLASRPTLEQLAAAGCVGVFIGLESGSDRVLAGIGKRQTVGQGLKAAKDARAAVGDVCASFIWGFPWESQEDLILTLGVMAYLRALGVEVRHSRLAPIPGTRIFAQYHDRLRAPSREDLRLSLLASVADTFSDVIIEFIQSHPELCGGHYVCESPTLEVASELVSRFHECLY